MDSEECGFCFLTREADASLPALGLETNSQVAETTNLIPGTAIVLVLPFVLQTISWCSGH